MLIGIFDPMGAQSDCLQCEVCQNLILSSMNTGFLRYAVATVLTVYGIETSFTTFYIDYTFYNVATVLTVYGIETNMDRRFTCMNLLCCNSAYRLRY